MKIVIVILKHSTHNQVCFLLEDGDVHRTNCDLHIHSFSHSFIHMACAECDDSLPFSGASSITLCYVFFPATLLHQLFFHPPAPHLAIYYLVYLSIFFVGTPTSQRISLYSSLSRTIRLLANLTALFRAPTSGRH